MTSVSSDSFPLPNRKATKRLARALALHLLPGDLIVLNGELGAGKTFLVRALCRALKLPERIAVVSPTFPLVRELPTDPPIVHADLYRLNDLEQAYELGLEEQREEGAILLVEWGDRFAAALGPDALSVTVQVDPRTVRLSANGSRSEQLLRAVLQTLSEAPGLPAASLPNA